MLAQVTAGGGPGGAMGRMRSTSLPLPSNQAFMGARYMVRRGSVTRSSSLTMRPMKVLASGEDGG